MKSKNKKKKPKRHPTEDCVDHNKLWEILRDGNTRPPDQTSWEICMQVKKQQLELYMEEQTGSK